MLRSPGADSQALYFVRIGRLKAVRLLSFRTYPGTKTKIRDELDDPSVEEIQAGSYVNEFIEIDELSNTKIHSVIDHERALVRASMRLTPLFPSSSITSITL